MLSNHMMLGSKGQKSSCKQARKRLSDLLTLVSSYILIYEKVKKKDL